MKRFGNRYGLMWRFKRRKLYFVNLMGNIGSVRSREIGRKNSWICLMMKVFDKKKLKN